MNSPNEPGGVRRLHNWSGGWCTVCKQPTAQEMPQFCPVPTTKLAPPTATHSPTPDSIATIAQALTAPTTKPEAPSVPEGMRRAQEWADENPLQLKHAPQAVLRNFAQSEVTRTLDELWRCYDVGGAEALADKLQDFLRKGGK